MHNICILSSLYLQYIMQPMKRRSQQEVPQKSNAAEKAELLEELARLRENKERLDKKMWEQSQKHQKIQESNMRNEKRLMRYKVRVEEMNRFRDSPEHFLTLSGYMNQSIQEYIFSHNHNYQPNHHEMPDPDNMTYEQLIDLGEKIGKVSKGLSKEQIEQLKHRKNLSPDEHCPICQNEIEVGEVVIELKCKHTYHEECIQYWLKDENTCPICKDCLTPERMQEQI